MIHYRRKNTNSKTYMYTKNQMYGILLFLLILVICFVLHLIYLFKQNERYINLDVNDSVLALFISNKIELTKKLEMFPSKIDVKNILPSNIDISYDTIKECGLYSKKKYKKGDIVYRFSLYRLPDEDIVISTPFGDRTIRSEIHTSEICNYYGIFTGFDCFINHSNDPNVDYDAFVYIENRKVFVNVYALCDIQIGDELLIDYHKGMCNPVVLVWKTLMCMYGFLL